jgi:hypothetical protein
MDEAGKLPVKVCVEICTPAIVLLIPEERKTHGELGSFSTFTRFAVKYPPPLPIPPILTNTGLLNAPFAMAKKVEEFDSPRALSSFVIR